MSERENQPMTIAQAYALAYSQALRRTNENRAETEAVKPRTSSIRQGSTK